MKTDKKLLICYNEPASFYKNYAGKDDENESLKIDLSESDMKMQINQISDTLKDKFGMVSSIGVNGNFMESIEKMNELNPDVILNFVESVEGHAHYESYVSGLFDILGIEYTGNTSLCLGNCLLKSRTKHILQAAGIRTPKYYVAELGKIVVRKKFELHFPVILKLEREDASIGISEFSVAKDFNSMIRRLEFLFENYKQNVLIEEYIVGRELNVSILGGKVLPVSEITFKGLPRKLPKIITYEAKWVPESTYYQHTVPVCPAKLPESVKKRIENIAIDAFRTVDCRDYARVDFRLTGRNVPYVIEVNPNPDISPDSGFVRSAAAAGISYEKLLDTIVSFALERRENDT